MEMEIPAFLFNFGIIGFILYFGPFLALFLYFMYFGIRNIRKIDSEYIILVFGLGYLTNLIMPHAEKGCPCGEIQGNDPLELSNEQVVWIQGERQEIIC